jgi:hypothetical protein
MNRTCNSQLMAMGVAMEDEDMVAANLAYQ